MNNLFLKISLLGEEHEVNKTIALIETLGAYSMSQPWQMINNK